MNILLTGASGFIGKCLLSRLSKTKHQVVTIDNREDGASFDNIQAFKGEPFSIVHLAWHSPREPLFSVAADHVAQMAQLLEAVKDRAERFICLGSADEYGRREGCLAPETESEGALSPYGWGKKCARELLYGWSETTGVPCFWLRPFTVYGEGQRGNMLLPYAIRQAQAKVEAAFSDGLQKRDFVYVDDVVEAIYLALQLPSEGFHAFNLGWGKAVEVRSVILDVARRFDAEKYFKLGALPRRTDEPLVRYADITAAKEILGWQPRILLDEGLSRMCASSETLRSEPKRKSSNG